MLVLTRKTDQSLVLSSPRTGEIEVFVIEIRGDQIRLGIQAPQSVPVHRTEVWVQIQEENVAASRTPAEGLLAVPAGKPNDAAKKTGGTTGLTLEEIRRRGKSRS